MGGLICISHPTLGVVRSPRPLKKTVFSETTKTASEHVQRAEENLRLGQGFRADLDPSRGRGPCGAAPYLLRAWARGGGRRRLPLEAWPVLRLRRGSSGRAVVLEHLCPGSTPQLALPRCDRRFQPASGFMNGNSGNGNAAGLLCLGGAERPPATQRNGAGRAP